MKSLVLAESRIPLKLMLSRADPESYYVRGGPSLTPFFFSLMKKGRIQIPLLAGHGHLMI